MPEDLLMLSLAFEACVLLVLLWFILKARSPLWSKLTRCGINAVAAPAEMRP